MNRRQFGQHFFSAVGVLCLGARVAFAKSRWSHLKGLKEAEWQTLSLVVDEIFPKGGGFPSASEAGVLEFLAQGFQDSFYRFRKLPVSLKSRAGFQVYVPYYKKLIRQVETLSRAKGKNFAMLSPLERTQMVRELSEGVGTDVGYRVVGLSPVEKISAQELFDMVKRHAILAMFSEPVYGGNKEYVGWKAISHTCHNNYPDKPESCPAHTIEGAK